MALPHFNVWPAFSDMVFVLFVSSLVGAAAFDHDRRQELDRRVHAEEERDRLNAELVALKKEKLNCGGAEPFFMHFTECLSQHDKDLAAKVHEERCQINVNEELVKFPSNKDTVTWETSQNAALLSKCLGDALIAFEQEPSFEAIDTIHVDGHTDCEAKPSDNLLLGALRARTLVMMIDRRVADVAPQKHRKIMERVEIGSFGEFRPSAGSPCATSDNVSVTDDRRVTITVAQRLQGGS